MAGFLPLSRTVYVAGQINTTDLDQAARTGIKSVINNRPDGEEATQPAAAQLEEACRRLGLGYRHIPVVSGRIEDAQVDAFEQALAELPRPVLAFCRSGTRAASLWALSEAKRREPEEVLRQAAEAGYKLDALRPRLEARRGPNRSEPSFDVLIVGGGCAGIAVAASLVKQRRGLQVAIVEPKEEHYYQPGWTLVGANAFSPRRAMRPEAGLIPAGVTWIRAACASFEPERNAIVLEDGERLRYRMLVVCPGIKLDWDAVEGLRQSLGKNGVTSNYMPGMATYTAELVRNFAGGTALFTQPPMPIKCAGAPQKAMYLSCDNWRRAGKLGAAKVAFHNAGAVLFGVKEFVPPLMRYVERYGAALNFGSNLKKVDGPNRRAWFEQKDADGKPRLVELGFDFLHVCPPQTAPDFIKASPLADQAGWVDVDQATMQHKRYPNVFGLGDAASTPNAKTAAAVRKQSPVVVRNLLNALDGKAPDAVYDGYGSCPLTVELGRVVLAEFGYGGKLLPTFPLDPTKPRRIWWLLKAKLLPFLYWDVLLRGREWLAKPAISPQPLGTAPQSAKTTPAS